MKRIEAYLPPHRLTRVVHGLHELASFPGLTVVNAHGQGHGRGEGGHYAYDEHSLTYLDRKLLVIICEDAEAHAIAELIATTAHTGNRGDGIVVISEVSEVLRIRETTGQSGSRVQGAMPVKDSNDAKGRRAKRRGNP